MLNQFWWSPSTDLVIVAIEMLTIDYKCLHVADELLPEIGLQSNKLVLHFSTSAQQLLPGVPQRVHFLCLLLCHRELVFVQHGIGLLRRHEQASGGNNNVIEFKIRLSCFGVYLNRSHLEVDRDLMLSDLLECRHGDANVIQILDLPVHLLAGLVHKCQDLLHLSAVLPVAVPSKVHDPALGLGCEGQLKIGYQRNKLMSIVKATI